MTAAPMADNPYDLLKGAMDQVFPGETPPAYVPPPVVPVEHRDESFAKRASSWCAKALEGKAAELAAMLPDTGRNHALNAAAYVCLRYVQAGYLDADDVVTTLRDAALECGLGNGEIEATLGSASRAATRDGPTEPPVDGTAPSPSEEPFMELRVDTETGELLPTLEELSDEQLSAKVRAALPVIDWHALWADESEEEWIVEPILPARRLVALYSAPKVGKSLLLLELCCAIATGRDVLGVSIDRPRNVLYVDFENDPKADVRERLQAMGYGPHDLSRLFYLSFPNLAALDSDRGGQEIMAAVAEYQCEVVVVDTVSRAIAGEENENDTWLAFYRHTGLRMKQQGIALIRLDHAGKDETKGQRGGSAKSGDVDAVWRLSRITDDSYRLDCEAARMPIAEKTLVLHREVAPLRHRVDAEGRSAHMRIKVEALCKVLDDLKVPRDAGRPTVAAVLRGAGHKAGDGTLKAVLAARQPRIGDPFEQG